MLALLIEENPEDASFFKRTLDQLQTKERSYQLLHARTLEEGLALLNKKKIDLIFTASSPSGTNAVIEIQKRSHSIPIIVIGSLAEEELSREAIHMGAQDYIPKEELKPKLLERAILFALERHQLRQSLKELSFTDELTSLYNRRGFMTLLEQQIALSSRLKKGFTLFLVDLDHLKEINDTFGHQMGDKALMSAAKCLKTSFRRHDILGRIGGDEFAVIAIHATSGSGEYLKKRLLQTIVSYNIETTEPFKLSLSIGGTFFDGSSEATLEDLVQAADLALYKEKKISHQ